MAQAYLDLLKKEPKRQAEHESKPKRRKEDPLQEDVVYRQLVEENAKLKLQVIAMTETRPLSKDIKFHKLAVRNLTQLLKLGHQSRAILDAGCTGERKAFESLTLRIITVAAISMRQAYESKGFDMSEVDANQSFNQWKLKSKAN